MDTTENVLLTSGKTVQEDRDTVQQDGLQSKMY